LRYLDGGADKLLGVGRGLDLIICDAWTDADVQGLREAIKRFTVSLSGADSDNKRGAREAFDRSLKGDPSVRQRRVAGAEGDVGLG
jgi:hypothetical protein